MGAPPTTPTTVETLTAEVRVIMIGKRQITLSVARQLDQVDLEAMEPWGRVRLRGNEHHVIGRRREGGDLVIASYRGTPPEPWFDRDNLDTPITVCSQGNFTRSSRHIVLKYGDRPIAVSTYAVEWCDNHAFTASPTANPFDCSDVWTANGQDALIRRVIAATDAWDAPHRAAAKLPLIVLAGLK